MKLYYNKSSGILSLTPGGQSNIQRIQGKRYTTLAIELIPTDADGVIEPFAPDAEGVCVVKQKGSFTGDAELLDTTWQPPATAEAGYLFSFVLAGADIDTLLGTDDKLTLALEMVWTDAGARAATPTVDLDILNNYWREGDPPPPDPETPFPLPAEILVKGAQTLSDTEKDQVKANLGLDTAAFRVTANGAEFYDATLAAWVRLTFDNGQPVYTTL